MKETIYKEDAIDAIVKCTNCNTPEVLREYVAEHSLWSQWSGGVLEALEAVEGLPSALPCPEGFDPEHLTEQDKKDILEALDWVKGTITEEVPSAQPEERTEECTETHACDCISRQVVIDMIMGQPPEAHYPSWYADIIKELPSAQPEFETGTWIWKHYVWWCSECGKNPTKGMGYVPRAEELFDYCPHCGKKMEGVQM